MRAGVRIPLASALTLAALLAACGGSSDQPPQTPSCQPSGTPISHSAPTITADETWAPGIHVVPQTITIRDGATLTLSPCSEIRLGADVSLSVELGGMGLVAPGTAANPITFVRDDPSSPWGHLSATAPGTMALASVTLEGGGGSVSDPAQAEYGGASLAAIGDVNQPPQVLSVDHVTVKDSQQLGVFMLGARFTDASTALTVTGAGYFPLYTGANALTELPTGSYTGNATDEILLQTIGPAGEDNSGAVLGDVTMHNRGVPYRIGASSSSIVVGDGYDTSPTGQLTIEAGVTLKFNPQTSLYSFLHVRSVFTGGVWQPQGALVVNGTATDPVRFTSASATPAAGDWQGIYFSDLIDSRSRIDHAVVEYAGADSSTVGYCPASLGASNGDADCSIILNLQDNADPTQFITNTDIHDGLGCGIYRGWKGSDIDYRPTNTFSNLTGCNQSGVRDQSDQCTACD